MHKLNPFFGINSKGTVNKLNKIGSGKIGQDEKHK